MSVSRRGNTGRGERHRPPQHPHSKTEYRHREGFSNYGESPFLRPEKGAAYGRTERDARRAPEPRQYHHDAEERADHCCGACFSITAAQKHSATSCSRRSCRLVRVYPRLTVKSRKKQKSCDNSRPDEPFPVRAVFIVKTPFSPSQEPEKTPEKCPCCVTGAQKGVCMRTGLTKREKTTDIWF